MKQFTVRTALEALRWLHTNAHHDVEMEFHPRTGEETHVTFRNYHEKMRVPIKIYREGVGPLIIPNKRPFDTRMFALTKRAKMMVNQNAT